MWAMCVHACIAEHLCSWMSEEGRPADSCMQFFSSGQLKFYFHEVTVKQEVGFQKCSLLTEWGWWETLMALWSWWVSERHEVPNCPSGRAS